MTQQFYFQKLIKDMSKYLATGRLIQPSLKKIIIIIRTLLCSFYLLIFFYFFSAVPMAGEHSQARDRTHTMAATWAAVVTTPDP